MQYQQTLKNIAARAGFHVVRNYQNPSHTMMGLLRHSFATILDVGANNGQFARQVRPHFPNAELHCFEPTPQAFAELQAWSRTQQRVYAIQTALGEHPDEMQMNLHTEHSTSSSLLATSARCEELYPFTAPQSQIQVTVKRLDDYMSGLPALPPGPWLLKIDVQGFEFPVLRGAPETLSKVQAAIVEVNLDNLYLGQSRFLDIVSIMADAGLNYAGNFQQMYDEDGHVLWLDATFVRGTPNTA